MSEDSAQRILDEIRCLRSEVQGINTAIEGDEAKGLEGIAQHLRRSDERLTNVEAGVEDLQNDRSRLKAWIAGLVASGGLGGLIGSWFSK